MSKWLGRNVKEFWDILSRSLHEQWEEIRPRSEALGYLKKLQLTAPPNLLLDCGCGSYALEPHWSRKVGEIISIDVSPNQIREANRKMKKFDAQNVHPITCDVASLPLRSALVDATLSLGVLRHLPEKYGYQAIQEMCRVTKKGEEST